MVSDSVSTGQGFPRIKLKRMHRPSCRVAGIIAKKLGGVFQRLGATGHAKIGVERLDIRWIEVEQGGCLEKDCQGS